MDLVRFLAHTFCCPPFPSRIAAKIAFHPPTPPSYKVKQTQEKGIECIFNEEMCKIEPDELAYTQMKIWNTSLGNRITVMHISPFRRPRCTLLCSHGNAGDLGLLYECYLMLARRLHCNVVCYDYSGYGGSSGRPSEADLYADVEAAWDCTLNGFFVPMERIVLYGHSIGTVASLYLACLVQTRGLILVAPLASGLHFLFAPRKMKRFGVFFNKYYILGICSLGRISKVKCPTLIVHGEADTIVHVEHSRLLAAKARSDITDVFFIPHVGHNDIELMPDFFKYLKNFLNKVAPFD
ncbi:alpha/beta hydrolase domain-containing protein 17C-like [Octopus sinensis]|uniref:Protein ABHD13 n=1 Tax=Octopus sinensis TaxID=2607531 RepID=A0A6P7U390_9MOLL|nr:alpha/beta hydrolase domain-containing protein 17C-like [Octopus sinensis]XP_029656234.1 alpha/beta hydrolase domain-containing protein 17C-like [Octopus sinensis]